MSIGSLTRHARFPGPFWALLALVAIASISSVRVAHAQLRGVVSTTDGRPLSAAIVELRRGGTRLGTRTTDSTGRFGFSTADARSATEIVARRIGFGAKRMLLARGDTVLRILLEGLRDASTTVALAHVAKACPNREDPEARAIWRSVKRRYRGADDVGLATTFSTAGGVVEREALGTVGPPAERELRRALPGTSRVAWRRRIALEGYAWLQVMKRGEYLSKTWDYPPLESDFAQHFIDRVFGRMHRMSMVARTDGELVIAFCAARGAVPALSGLLMLTPDTTLMRAIWRLRTPAPAEESGGEVIFAQHDASAGIPILLPRRGLFWRQHPQGGYFQRWLTFDPWTIDRADDRRAAMIEERDSAMQPR